MKILHTSDWHLGQKFIYRDREAEHRQALEWLIQTIKKEDVDVLIVAGDVFDIGNPPNYARQLYYRFLTNLLSTDCRHIVITGGNHDSPSMLNAPGELLRFLNVYVVGSATDPIEDEIIELKNAEGKLEAVVAAVPFLRDRDLRHSQAGESGMERIEQIKTGIYRHYQEIGKAVKKYTKAKVPIVATGHLYAKGATVSGKQDNIYIGNMENIEAGKFPSVFHYVALGHLHRCQSVGKSDRIYYSGSLIPLSFSEIEDKKAVLLIEFEDNKILDKVRRIPVPNIRPLLKVEGSLEEVQESLEKIAQRMEDSPFTAWVEVIVRTDKLIPNLNGLLQEYIVEMPLELLKVRTDRKFYSLESQTPAQGLEELEELDVFRKKCESYGSPPEEMEELEMTFRELKEWMGGREEGRM